MSALPLPSNAPPAPAAAPAAFYDAGRGVFYAKPALRGWLHLLWFEASLICGTLLLVVTHGTGRIASVAIYVGSVSALFGVSALYHRGNWGAVARRRLQRLDHMMIFLLIAGTATPTFVIATDGLYRTLCLSVLWGLTVTIAVVHFAWMGAPERLVGAAFVGLGWTAGLALPAVWIHAGVAPGVLMLLGGLLYTAGAISYHRRRPDPSPAIFGYHEVFHTYVCLAAACHYIAIAVFLV